MPSPQRHPGLWLGLAGTGLLVVGSLLGWWAGEWQRSASRTAERSVQGQVERLLPRVRQGKASVAEQQKLLELLVALNRRPQAIDLLETLADRQPERWSLRLLLAELRREQGDRAGAERELRQLLARRPDRIEALSLMAFLLLETRRGLQAEALVQAALIRARSPVVTPEALKLGLLLANVQQQLGRPSEARATLTSLTAQFPRDPRPLLASALLLRQAGDGAGANKALVQARALSSGSTQEKLDQMAIAWGLQSLRQSQNQRNLREPG
ncbi:MAG: tetratricopeptide repeat protein [Cyanobacteriota bacterium]|nr:tetratricopeptide repeat protein [Cyanobacteriota bacterium]